ncbi:MAG: TerB family tellurite resistance protein [Pseudomonadota bacterium]
MLRILTELFDSLKPAESPAGIAGREHTLELVTAVLLVEVVRADGQIEDSERAAVLAALRSRFSLTEQQLSDLFELALHKSEHAHDLHSFTALINKQLNEPERIRVFELLWTVAYANGRADDHEAHLLRRLADLLHIRHGDAIGAKLRAERG